MIRKNSIYEELERVLDQLQKHHMIILLEDLNTKLGRKLFSIKKKGMGYYMKLGEMKVKLRAVEFAT